MKKKIWSLVLCLSMLASFVTVMPTASAAEPTNTVTLNYYASKDDFVDSTKIDTTKAISNIGVGEDFYAVIGLKDTGIIQTASVALKYDPQKLTLMSSLNANDDPVNIEGEDEGSRKGYPSFGECYALSQGILQEIAGVPISVVSSSNGKICVTTWSQTGHEFDADGEQYFFLRLRAKEDIALSEIVTLDTEYTRTGLNYETSPERGIYLTERVLMGQTGMLSTVDATVVNKDFARLSVGTLQTIQLDTPSGLALNGNKIDWADVDNASGYEVDYEIKDENGTVLEESDSPISVTASEFAIPAYNGVGDLYISVKAKGDGSTYSDSSWSAAETDYTYEKTLAQPQNVKFDGEKLTWNTVDNADYYTITIKRNGQTYGQPIEADTAEATLELALPETGSYTYEMTVVAGSTSKFYKDSPASAPVSYTVKGKVNKPTNAAWKDVAGNNWTAEWTSPADKSNIKGFEIVLYSITNVETDVKTITVNNPSLTSYDFTSVVNGEAAGRYKFRVRALGNNGFANSDYEYSSNEKIKSVQLGEVSSITLNAISKIVSWSDSQQNVSSYKVELIDAETDGVISTKTVTPDKREVSFDAEIPVAGGIYRARITAVGNGTTYLTGPAKESANTTIKPALTNPSPALWDTATKQATWPAVAGASGYTVSLYYEGKKIATKIISNADIGVAGTGIVNDNGTIKLDYTSSITYPGKYEFDVRADANGVANSSSETVKSDEYTHTVTRTGDIVIGYYADEELTTPVTDVKYGDIVYIGFTLENTNDMSSVTLPFFFDNNVFTAVDENGTAVTTDISSSAKAVVALNEELKLNVGNNYPCIDNEAGFAKIFFASNSGDVVIGTSTKLAAVRVKVKNVATVEPVKFATNADEVYDDTAQGGAKFTNTLLGQVFVNEVINTVTASKNKLVVDGLKWTNKTAKWSKADGADRYEVVLYRDGVEVYRTTVRGSEVSFASKMGKSGDYTFTVKPLAAAGSTLYEDGNEVESEAKTVKEESKNSYGGGTGGGGIVIGQNPAPERETVDGFNDVSGHWAEKDILSIIEDGIINGYDDGSFRPDWGITRAEFTKLMVTALNQDGLVDDYVYEDTADHWAKNYIAVGTKIGIVNGVGENKFDPDSIITREQIALILYRIADKPESEFEAAYADRFTGISDWARDAVDFVSENAIMIGFEDTTFRGKEQTTRAQAVTILVRLLKMNFFSK